MLSPRADLTVLMILVVGHAAFNALFAPFGTPASDYPSTWAFPVIGAIGVQPVLFAMWGALSPSIVKSLPWALVGCVVVAYAESIRSLRLIAASTTNGAPFQSVLFVLAVFVVATVLLLIVRHVFSYRIVCDVTNQLQPRSPEDSQFTLRHLLCWTAVCAVLLALGRLISPHGTGMLPVGDLGQAVAQMAGFLGIFCLFLFPTVAVPWIALTFRPKASLLMAGAFAAWAALSWITISVLCAVTPASPTEATEAIVLIQLGAATSGCVTALPLRICGFRIRRGHHVSRRQ